MMIWWYNTKVGPGLSEADSDHLEAGLGSFVAGSGLSEASPDLLVVAIGSERMAFSS